MTHKIHVVVMVTGDPATLMISLCQGLKGFNCPTDWVDMLKERDIEKEKANRYITMLIVETYLTKR